MKCNNCGGELFFENRVVVCSSCKSIYRIESVFENVEVCICYIENDINGRRTKDSIIAGEVYKKLESKKINTFYEHVSAANVIGDDLESLRYSAISGAKIIVLVGTSTENFSSLYEKYSSVLVGKKIIPVIGGMKPEELPKELRGVQASNYDSIGALNDLSTSLLNFLGRSDEVELEEIYNKKAKKKKLIRIIALSLLAAMVCVAVALTIAFWPEKEEPVVLTDNDIYNSAVALLNEEKYLEAVAEFNKILDYKDSSNQVKKIYDRYDGYYQDEEGVCSLYLNIIDGKTVEFSFEKIADNKIVKIENSMVLENNRFGGGYIDSLSNEGDVSVVLNNDFVGLKVSTSVKNGKISIGSVNLRFELKNKSDRPPIKTVTKEMLLDWMANLTYVEDIKAFGYELEFIEEVSEIPMMFGAQYKIVNTDITIVTTDEDLTKYNGEYLDNPPKLEKSAVVAVIVPVNLVCPEKIGKKATAFTKDGIIYIPNTQDCSGFDEYFSFSTTAYEENHNSFIVDKNSFVGITSKKLVGEYIFDSLIESNNSFLEDFYKAIVFNQFQKDNPGIDGDLSRHLLAQNNNSVLVCVHLRKMGYSMNSSYIPGNYYYYKLDIKTEKAQFITEHSDEMSINTSPTGVLVSEFNYEKWKRYPDLFGDFLTE